MDRGCLQARPDSQRTPAQRELLALSDALIDDVMAADVIPPGVPMPDYSVPASFKAWIDQIARAGRTFSYSDPGPKGLMASEVHPDGVPHIASH